MDWDHWHPSPVSFELPALHSLRLDAWLISIFLPTITAPCLTSLRLTELIPTLLSTYPEAPLASVQFPSLTSLTVDSLENSNAPGHLFLFKVFPTITEFVSVYGERNLHLLEFLDCLGRHKHSWPLLHTIRVHVLPTCISRVDLGAEESRLDTSSFSGHARFREQIQLVLMTYNSLRWPPASGSSHWPHDSPRCL